MQNRYWLPPRKAVLCRFAGAVFLLAALAMLPVIAFAGLTPGASPYCGGGDGCVWKSQPAALLGEEIRAKVDATAETRRAFDNYAARPMVRVGLAGIEAVHKAPFAVLLLGVGLALRRLGGRGFGALAQALKWLRLACIAAILWALTSPIYESMLESFLSPGTPTGARWQLTINLANICTGLLLATAAYAAIWAVEAGLRAQRDLENFV